MEEPGGSRRVMPGDEISGTGDHYRNVHQSTQVSWSRVGRGGQGKGLPRYPNMAQKCGHFPAASLGPLLVIIVREEEDHGRVFR